MLCRVVLVALVAVSLAANLPHIKHYGSSYSFPHHEKHEPFIKFPHHEFHKSSYKLPHHEFRKSSQRFPYHEHHEPFDESSSHEIEFAYDQNKYYFSWEVSNEYGNDYGHNEHRDGYDTKGSYYVNMPEGRIHSQYSIHGDSEREAKHYDSDEHKSSEHIKFYN